MHSKNNGRYRATVSNFAGCGGKFCAARVPPARGDALDGDILPADHRRVAAAASDNISNSVGGAQLLWNG